MGRRRSFQKVAERAREAGTFAELGDVIVEASRDLLGVSGACLMPIPPRSPIGDGATAFHEQFSSEHMREQTLQWFPATIRDVGSIQQLARGPFCAFDVNERMRSTPFSRSETFNEYWRPCRIERQLLAIWQEASGATGFLCASRTSSEPAFDGEDMAQFSMLGRIAERESARISTTLIDRVTELFAALSVGVPMPCALFDSIGRVLWRSELAVDELEARHLEWSGLALSCLKSGVRTKNAGDLFAQRIETTSGTPTAFVVRNSVAASAPARVDDAIVAWRLTARESDVLEQLAQGRANKEIAQALGISTRTVEVHITSLLSKSGCSSRSELLARLWNASFAR